MEPQPVALGPTFIIGFILMVVFAVHFRQKHKKREDSSAAVATVDAIAGSKYNLLLAGKATFRLAYNAVGAITAFSAIYVASKTHNDELFSKQGACLTGCYLGGFLLTCACLHYATCYASHDNVMFLYRAFYIATQIGFRGLRIVDFLSAPDCTAFSRAAAGILEHHSSMTTYSCFVVGWLLGMMQPAHPLAWRVWWAIGSTSAPLLPAAVGFLVTGELNWLSTCVRVILVPSALGFLIELLQRYFIKALLRRLASNEMVLLPQGSVHLPAPLGGAVDGGAASSQQRSGSSQEPVSLRDFEPVGILGFGGSAQVRLVRNTRDGELQALKSVFKTRTGQSRFDSERITKLAEAELSILRAVHDHPFIVSLVDAFDDAIAFHFVIEYAANGPLSQWIEPKGLSEQVARSVAAELVLALEHLHSHAIVYRDLKPSNVLVHANGHTVLADFGISKRLSFGDRPETESMKTAVSLVGTPGYMAPEIVARMPKRSDTLRAEPYSFPADWWSFGVLCHVMLALEEPFDMRTILDIVAEPSRQHEFFEQRVSPSLSDHASNFISELLNFDVSARLGTAFGAADVRAHPFFAGIDWDATRRGCAEPPLPSIGACSWVSNPRAVASQT